jgi:HlyD family secretion protein
MEMKNWKIFTIVLVALALGAGVLLLSSGKKAGTAAAAQNYDFTTIGRGSIESDVSSSGTLAVVNSVGVLAQMNGQIETLNVDYNDRVKKGEVLATINTELLKLGEKQAQAAVDKAQANYDLQVLAVQNAQALASKGLLSDYDLKTSAATLEGAKADLASAQASLEQIQTQINQYAIISSPIDGIVLQRDIDLGQSVVGGASATSTPLFTLTDDLAKMEIDAQVDELDISGITVGQAVHFSVEAYPSESFLGTVKEIRLLPETTNSVVYYDVMIDAYNKSGKLLPGMTANVNFVKQRKDNVLVVPSSALRFAPPSLSAAEVKKAIYLAGLGNLTPDQLQAASARYDAAQKAIADGKAPAARSSGLTSLMSGNRFPGGGFGGPPPGGPPPGGRASGSAGLAGAAAKGASASAPASAPAAAAKKTLWYLDDSGKLAVALVEPGLSDGLTTELVGADRLEGRKVILKIKAE